MPTILTEEQTQQLLNDMTNNQDLTFHVDYLNEVDPTVSGAYGTAPGYFWVVKDADDAIVRLRRIIVSMEDGQPTRTALVPSDLDERTLQISLKAMLKSVFKEEAKKYNEGNVVGPYDMQKMSKLLGF